MLKSQLGCYKVLTACSRLVDNKFEFSSPNTNYRRFVDRIAKRCELYMRVPHIERCNLSEWIDTLPLKDYQGLSAF